MHETPVSITIERTMVPVQPMSFDAHQWSIGMHRTPSEHTSRFVKFKADLCILRIFGSAGRIGPRGALFEEPPVGALLRDQVGRGEGIEDPGAAGVDGLEPEP